MGIHGIYKEIGSGRRIALSKYALDTFISKRRPLRLAVDISIWLFQIKSSKGGEQPALRTFYYRLLRLTSLAVNPLFVFDGPNKPKFKRNKHTGPNVCTIPEFLAKQLLKEFGLPYHVAPGEAEAECAQLQRAGVVDAVLSEDVDTIMFGSGITLRNWSAEGKGKVPTHVNLYDSKVIKQGSSGLDREGMILVAMMSGGDYIPEGIPGCGPKTACEAARAGFGANLCKIEGGDKKAFETWRAELAHELRSNESKFFRVKHGALQIPESFPNREILRYYTHPAVSNAAKIEELRSSIVWQKQMDLAALRKFTEEAFKWETIGGAKKFIRTLAPALLVRELSSGTVNRSHLARKIHAAREHVCTDNTSELRVSYIPQDVVHIDLSLEVPEDVSSMPMEMEEDDDVAAAAAVDEGGAPSSSQMRPYLFNPAEPTKSWIFEHFLQIGAPAPYEQWKKVRDLKASKLVATVVRKDGQQQQKKGIDATMPVGAMHQFARVVKPGISRAAEPAAVNTDRQKLPFPDLPATSYSNREMPPFRSARSMAQSQPIETINLAEYESPIQMGKVLSTALHASSNNPSLATGRRRSPFVRSRTEGSKALSTEILDLTVTTTNRSTLRVPLPVTCNTSKRKAQLNSPRRTPKTTRKSSSIIAEPILISSSPSRQESITQYFSPSRSRRSGTDHEVIECSPTRPTGLRSLRVPEGLTEVSSQPNNSLSTSELVPRTMASQGESLHMPLRFNATLQTQQPSALMMSSTPQLSHNEGLFVSQRSCPDLTTAFPVFKARVTIDHGTVKALKTSRAHLKACDGNTQRVRVRHSLRGAFAVEDVVNGITPAAKALTSTWPMRDVSVMDLTGDL